jgi:protein-L-isoaspartate(D-aspartate) O-methyltransferase
MVECQLATNNVISEGVLRAMETVPREDFLPDSRKDAAYLDEDVLIGEGRYLMEPMVLARLIQAADPQPHDVVLDVGSSSGYSAAVLSQMVETVIAVEPNETLMEHAVRQWRKMDVCNIAELQDDIVSAACAHGPYDIIFMNGAVCEIPLQIVNQLKNETGRMVCILRENPTQNGQAVLVKIKGDTFSTLPLFDASVPYLQEFKPKERFIF